MYSQGRTVDTIAAPSGSDHAMNARNQTSHEAGGVIGSRLAAIVLLGGSVRTSDFGRALDRSVIELPIVNGGTILEDWREQAERLCEHLAKQTLPLRVLIDKDTRKPIPPESAGRVSVLIETDRVELRGTGGLLKDIADELPDDHYVLVGNANSILIEPLSNLYDSLAAPGADISILARQDGTPCGLKLCRAGALKVLRGNGFIDLKEQALPDLARRFDVRVVQAQGTCVLPLRTLDNYIQAQRVLSGVHGGPVKNGDFSEQWSPCFKIVEEGSEVHPSAMVHDSVVLRGATVGAGAVLVRSVVSAGARVQKSQFVRDEVVGTSQRGGRLA